MTGTKRGQDPRRVLTPLCFLTALAWAQLPVADDPLIRMPGTQPYQFVALEPATNCENCHAYYSPDVEPVSWWKGSMMAQAARDPLFWACLTSSAQDSMYAIGRPNAVDLCLRCHTPGGWLARRSSPVNGSGLVNHDFDGVTCDLCHRMYDPFYRDTFEGTREERGPAYWDETNASATPSWPAAARTRERDALQASNILLFNGNFFFAGDRPVSPRWDENGSGQYFVDQNPIKRAGFADARPGLHGALYSRYHKSRWFCGTCHDVSNTALANLAFEGTPPGNGVTVLPSEELPAHAWAPVERTFSEFLLSDFGRPGGAPGTGSWAPGRFVTSRPGSRIATCQDCHLSDAPGQGCRDLTVPRRPEESLEHPRSGVPRHDLTGGNAWVPWLLASAVPGSPNFDAVNHALLAQGPEVLTLDLSAGAGLDPNALIAGSLRAELTLARAATIEELVYVPAAGAFSFRLRNHTGHKLPTGFPEGRRMWLNVRAFRDGRLLHEVNPYDRGASTLRGLDCRYSPGSPPLGPEESHDDRLVYEAHMSSGLTGESVSFHFLLATGRFKDNRVPPRGFRVAEAPARGCEPVWAGASAPGWFTAAEYAGGHDDLTIALPPGADLVEVALWYQTTSREYVEFLRDEITGQGRRTLPPWAYVIQSDPFFARLRAWGPTIWQLWDHNRHVPGAAPVLMTRAAWSTARTPLAPSLPP